jgi:hypothetical protein
MAKVHKVTMFVTDIEGDSDIEDLVVCGLRMYDLYPEFINVDSSEEFEWDDDLAINKMDSTKEDYEKYFSK